MHPDDIKNDLAALCKDLNAIDHFDLKSIYLYKNSYEAEEKRAATLLIIYDDIDQRLLEEASAVFFKHSHVPARPIILSLEEVRSSADVFPVSFIHFKMNPASKLYGEDVFKRITVSLEDLRLGCEQELKKIIIELRACYLKKDHLETSEVDLSIGIAKILSLLDVAHFLKTGFFTSHQEMMYDFMRNELQLNEEQLATFMSQGKKKDLGDSIQHCMLALTRMAKIVDKYRVF